LITTPVDRVHITFGGRARELPQTDPITRAVLRGYLRHSAVADINNINVRSAAASLGLAVEEKRSDEAVTFNEWLHVQLFNGSEKVLSAGGTFFGSPNNPRIVRLYSTPVEIPITGTLLLLNNEDRPGIVGKLGTVLARHQVNIASMSLGRETIGGKALTALELDSTPSKACLDELAADPAISNIKVVVL
jgi:D-3-phosphoglycerate dehydrogenase